MRQLRLYPDTMHINLPWSVALIILVASNRLANCRRGVTLVPMDTPVPKEIAIVLGAAVWPGGVASPTLRRRSLRACALWHSGRISAIIPCGGVGKDAPSEAQVIRDILLENGVPGDVIHLEARSVSTQENLEFARPVWQRLGGAGVVIVTDLYHVPRACMVARRQGMRVSSVSPDWRESRARSFAKASLREVPAYLWYWWRKGN